MDTAKRRLSVLLAVIGAAAACGTTSPDGGGGSSGTGGELHAGGRGGSSTGATGGRPSTGGGPSTGGNAGASAGGGRGGNPGSGGALGGRAGASTGGSNSSGGAGRGGAGRGGAAAGGRDVSAGGRGGTAATGGKAGSGPGTGGNVGGTAGTSGGASDILVPAQGALLGLYYGAGTQAATNARIGRTPQIHLQYLGWDDPWEDEARADLDAGLIPLISWEPGGVDFHDIVSGALDANIKARAKGAKALGKKLFLDFAAESNGDEAWSGNDAPLYVAAYQHIHDLFVAGGATNVVWVWCPNVTDTDGTNNMTLAYYPGDAYVDWTGVDGYNWGGAEWQSFEEIFRKIYPLLATKKKPIFIGEMASAEQGGDKAAFIDGMVPTLKSKYPLIKALVWFDVNKERDWRINSSSTSLAAFARMATDPYFNP